MTIVFNEGAEDPVIESPDNEVAAAKKKAARELTDRIKRSLVNIWVDLREAYTTGAWFDLGYSTWNEYCYEEFDSETIKIPRSERSNVISLLTDAGMSQREIAAATGLDQSTVSRSSSDANASVVDLDNRDDYDPDQDFVPPEQPVSPAPPSITPVPDPPARRDPFTKEFYRNETQLLKSARELENLLKDDRFPKYQEQIIDMCYAHFQAVRAVIDAILGDNEESE